MEIEMISSEIRENSRVKPNACYASERKGV
jgi:hypothetical protein